MSFKVPDRPSARALPCELADFAELLAWSKGSCSSRSIQNHLSRLDDNDYNVGVEDTDDIIEALSDEMIDEIGHRVSACGDRYPFRLAKSASVLEFVEPTGDFSPYLYLLLATRFNMKSNSTHGGHDGTKLFERVSAQVIREYLGPDRAKSMILGTAEAGGFEEKVNRLCKEVKEGGGFRQKITGAINANDDKVDVIGWIPFSDSRGSQLVIFGQSKTGTSWSDSRCDLLAPNFVKKWMFDPFLVDPLSAFFIADAAQRAQWERLAVDMGLLFDRCRVVDFWKSTDLDLTREIDEWTSAGKDYLDSQWD